VKIVSKRARRKRAQIFQKHFIFNENTKILDLGTERCENITMVLSGLSIKPENVYVADIDLEFVKKGAEKYGYTPVVISESGQLPFADEYFDIVYCSSVIEHVTIPKEQIWKVYSGRRFHTESYARQKEFSKEIKRLGKNYFVQTPNIHFPLESHSLLPFASWLPRRLLLSTLRLTNKFWIKQSDPDWHLLDKKKMHELFNEATIVEEKLLGITKSIMAIYKKQ
jgi:hypothetical protein